jgi:hypothetical protein
MKSSHGSGCGSRTEYALTPKKFPLKTAVYVFSRGFFDLLPKSDAASARSRADFRQFSNEIMGGKDCKGTGRSPDRLAIRHLI